jgi:hypothetical protein
MSELGDNHGEEPGRLTAAAAYLLEGEYKCDSCSRPTKVFTVMAAGPLKVEGDVFGSDEGFSCVLRRIDSLPLPLAFAADAASGGRFRPDDSRMAGERYFMNHCNHCGGKVGDWYIHSPGEAFFPTHPNDITRVTGQRFEGPFVFDEPDASWSSWTDDWLEANGIDVPRPPPTVPKKPRAKRTPK